VRLILGPTLISLCRRKSIEVKGLSSTGTAHKTAFDTEAEAYNTSESRVSELLKMEKVIRHVTATYLLSIVAGGLATTFRTCKTLVVLFP
jgi:hypothetical protein